MTDRDMIPELDRLHHRATDMRAIPDLVYEALRFANFAAGEGICPDSDDDGRDPALFLSEYTDQTGDDDWDALPGKIRDAITALLREAGEGWRPIESAAKPEPDKQIELGIERNGTLEEIHLGRWMPDVNEQGEDMSCWWSDQSDDEIRPTHWRPARPLPAPPAAGAPDAED